MEAFVEGALVEFDLGLTRLKGEIVKENDATVIIKTKIKGEMVFIKRHKIKHKIEFIDGG